MVLLALLLGCAPGGPVAPLTGPPGGVDPQRGLLLTTFSWTPQLLPAPGETLPAREVLDRMAAVEVRTEQAVLRLAPARADAGLAVLRGLAASPPVVDAAAVDALVAADRALVELAATAVIEGVQAVPAAQIAGLPDGAGPPGLAVTFGPLDELIGHHGRSSLPPLDRFVSVEPGERAAVEAAEKSRTAALDAAVTAWKDTLGGWKPAEAPEELRAAVAALVPALERSLRGRVDVGQRLLAAMDETERLRVLLNPAFQDFVGAGGIASALPFESGQPAMAAEPAPPPPAADAPPVPAGAAAFPPGTGDPGDFPPGTGATGSEAQSQMGAPPPSVDPPPDGKPPPPGVDPPPDGKPPPPGVDPPPDGKPPPPGVDPPPGSKPPPSGK